MMATLKLPPYEEYMNAVQEARAEGKITHTQLIILRNCYKTTFRKGEPLHFNYLQKATSQTKEECKWELNDLLRTGAIQSPRSNYYWLGRNFFKNDVRPTSLF